MCVKKLEHFVFKRNCFEIISCHYFFVELEVHAILTAGPDFSVLYINFKEKPVKLLV